MTQWLGGRGETTIRQIVRKWGVSLENAPELLGGLFKFLTDEKLLVPVKLKGSRGNALAGLSGLYQIDADRLRLTANRGVWRCTSCRRRTTHRTPQHKCPAWRCDGTLGFLKEDPDNYDLQLLDQGYSMIRPEEHTAMVPHEERERLENLFKGDAEVVNTFVCTPTLELGVDIGQLDAVLMRNVPPLPANYWQRAGRAGRRHRMAVDMTYCRPVSHDRAYFADPVKLLAGRVDPPSFNLRNELMVAKHVHATVVTRLHQLARDASRPEAERARIEEVLHVCLPDKVGAYLFDEGNIRQTAFMLTPLRELLRDYADDLTGNVERAFRQGWPDIDAEVTRSEALRAHVLNMADGLDEVVGRLRRRLTWALEQIKRLNRVRENQGELDPEDESIFRRCDGLIKRLKGTSRRARREAEGYDDANTFGVLAAEGFLPGYGLEVGSILGTAEIPFWRTGAMEFVLPRPPSVALREYVPGNLIYANGNRFVARRFHRDVDEQRIEIPVFEVSSARQAVKPTIKGAAASGLGSVALPTIAVCDVDLIHQSHISDEEELRFQLGVSVYGLERDQHHGGTAYVWGERNLHHRRGVRLRLVNVGATTAIIRKSPIFGYPICTVCGQSVSPLSTEKQRQHFAQSHKERCGKTPEPVGFYADIVADVISLPACENHSVAFSVLEALRFAATRVLDMHMEDLQVLVIGHVDRDDVDALLWDPMPGGSGLLDQICERFEEIVAVAVEVVRGCPAACETSCIDCLQTFRNSFYHKYLNRKLALERLEAWGTKLQKEHIIPPQQPTAPSSAGGRPVNEGERKLQQLLLAAGFGEGVRCKQIKLDRAIGTTTPDVIFRAPHHEENEGVCIYLDGFSGHLHGNPETIEQDQRIRSWLRNNSYEVIEISRVDLDDPGAMSRHFRKLAGYLGASDLRENLRTDVSWFTKGAETAGATKRFEPRIIQPREDEKYVSCVPLVPLKAAAGAFSDPQNVLAEDWPWVEISSGHRLRKGMFVAQAVGKSMEPAIPDGSYCLFSSPVTGTRQGRTVLVQLRDQIDPESGERYTVKRYRSEKSSEADGSWRHVKITLEPINNDYQPIVVTSDDEGQIAVIAEMIQVLA